MRPNPNCCRALNGLRHATLRPILASVASYNYRRIRYGTRDPGAWFGASRRPRPGLVRCTIRESTTLSRAGSREASIDAPSPISVWSVSTAMQGWSISEPDPGASPAHDRGRARGCSGRRRRPLGRDDRTGSSARAAERAGPSPGSRSVSRMSRRCRMPEAVWTPSSRPRACTTGRTLRRACPHFHWGLAPAVRRSCTTRGRRFALRYHRPRRPGWSCANSGRCASASRA